MPKPRKPGVDWQRICQRWQDEWYLRPEDLRTSLHSIGREEGISHTAISKRARRENWAKLAEERRSIVAPPVDTRTIRPQERTEPVNGPRGMLTPALMDQIIAELKTGWTVTMICKEHGFERNTYYEWMRTNEDFSLRVDQARNELPKAAMQTVADDVRKNPNTALKLVQTHEHTRDEYGGPRNGNNPLAHITLNIPIPGSISNFDEALAWHDGAVTNQRPIANAPALRDGAYFTPQGFRCTAEVAAWERGWRPACGLTHQQYVDKWMADHPVEGRVTIDITPSSPA